MTSCKRNSAHAASWGLSDSLAALAGAMAIAALVSGTACLADSRSGEVDGYRYRLFVPGSAPSPEGRPLVVVLHGCKQTSADIARVSGFNSLAAEQGFAVLYPETAPSRDNPYGCWRWWAPENQLRQGGEPEVFVRMISEVSAGSGVDRRRVYAVGFSSGGAMSAILGALYPELFAAVGVHSGLPYAAAGSAACALAAMDDGAEDAAASAAVAFHAQGDTHRVVPLLVIQGDEDVVVAPENAERLIEQFARLNDLADDGDGGNESIDARADETREAQVTDGYAYRIRSYRSASGVEVMREVRVPGLGHAWSGGKRGERFSDPKGPDAARLFWAFAKERTADTFPLRRQETARCRERYGSNFAHYWWYGRMSRQEYRCDAWGFSWRRAYDGHWTAGRCP